MSAPAIVRERLVSSGVKVEFVYLGDAKLIKGEPVEHLGEPTTRTRDDGNGEPAVED